MKRIIAVGAGLYALFAAQAWAASVPELSGTYNISVAVVCQATSTSTGYVANRLLSVNFNARTKITTVKGIMTYGPLLVPDGATAGLTQIPVAYTSPFSNTATTLTTDNATVNVLYGPVNADGVVTSYTSSGPVAVYGLNCIETATATRP